MCTCMPQLLTHYTPTINDGGIICVTLMYIMVYVF